MEPQEIRDCLLAKPCTEETFPFGQDVSVFKVCNKMFATLALGTGREKGTDGKMAGHYCINLKCDPDEAAALRDVFDAVIPGYHMNKLQWNTVILNGTVPTGELVRMIDNSYLLVVNNLTKKQQSVIFSGR